MTDSSHIICINDGGGVVKKKIENVVLDQEWITLIKEAKKLGLSLEEVRQFLVHIREKTKV
ncbi:anti-repressor SinI family protein [Oceanobacillus neutriphilus]|uniref:Sin domain-containing protein n=1 Tax=Oceanobacillus neutriphilus TaxID=531815 RepID=A0ABQ2NZ24_9BACI|nr:anti-repressor SinI family protein [Oceanobacillus neutriphilus]GGP14001.1 hypothetical protein GCM10011346_36230 [Oceanobacillus neutriphilus]